MLPLRRCNAASYSSLQLSRLPKGPSPSALLYVCSALPPSDTVGATAVCGGRGAEHVTNTNGAGPKSGIRSPRAPEAPAIELPAGPARTWALQRVRGQSVVLAFYPADWEPVSADQLRSYNDVLPEIHRLHADVVGVSVDSVWSHEAFARDLLLRFRLLSDFHPRGHAARAYGVYLRRQGFSARAIFVIDAAGRIRWRYRAPFEVNPGVDGILTALEALADERAATEPDTQI